MSKTIRWTCYEMAQLTPYGHTYAVAVGILAFNKNRVVVLPLQGMEGHTMIMKAHGMSHAAWVNRDGAGLQQYLVERGMGGMTTLSEPFLIAAKDWDGLIAGLRKAGHSISLEEG
jgi:hypothetical protein